MQTLSQHMVLRCAIVLVVAVVSGLQAGDEDAPSATGPAVVYTSLPLGSRIRGIAADAVGNLYMTGSTPSVRGVCAQFYFFGTLIHSDPCDDAFVAKLDPTGNVLYRKTLGGTNADVGVSIAADDYGNAYVLGSTYSPDFPVTLNAAQRQYGGLFVAKLGPFGGVVYSTFLGGADANRIRIDSAGNAYVAGWTYSPSFPSAAPPQPFKGSIGIVAKINSAGTQVTWSTYLPRYYKISGFDVDATGALYVAGLSEAGAGGITKFSADSRSVIYDFPFGTPRDVAYDLAVDSHGSAWVVGTNGLGSSFIRKLKPGGSGLEFEQTQTSAWAFAVAVDLSDRAYIGGESKRLFVTPNALQPNPGAVDPSGFLSALKPDGTVIYASYAPARIVALALDMAGHVYVSDGRTVTKTNLNLPALTAAVNSASRQNSEEVAPGELITLFGGGLGPQDGVSAQRDAAGNVATVLAGRRVFFDDTPAPILFASGQRIDTVVPFALAPGTSTGIRVEAGGQSSRALLVRIVSAEPAIFALFGEGRGSAAARNEDGSLNLLGNPAPQGSIVTFFATGAGPFDPPLADGQPAPIPSPLVRQPIQVFFDDVPCEILFAGAAPGLVGVTQINVRVPTDLPAFPHNVKVSIMVGSIRSQPAVTIAIQ